MSLEKIARLRELEKQGYVSSSKLDNLVLFNYTDRCTYDRHWNEDTLSARGTIYNTDTGEVVARSFDKFFNLNEHTSTIENLPKLPFVACEKVDGSLGIVFHYDESLRIATRGSFYSDQAKEATKMIDLDISYYTCFYDLVSKGYTPLVEIVYPENRIVVDYGTRRWLVLLAARKTSTGEYMSNDALVAWADRYEVPVVQTYTHALEQLLELKTTLNWQEEGWVLVYSNGYRVKVKGEDYCRIAKIKSCLSPLSVWEAMVAGKAEEYLSSMPDEIHEECKAIYMRLHQDIDRLLFKAEAWADIVLPDAPFDYKEVALAIKEQAPKWIQPMLFQKMRGRDPYLSLLDRIRPTGNQYVDVETLYA